jgi:DNA-binding winged helix-turn-helix (wHTH) protein
MDSEEISFGRFRLRPGRRELLRDEVPVRLHRRSLDILCALAAAKGAIVGKDELMARLWPGRIVEEGNLHVHVSALRKSLDEHGEGHSFVVTVPGRGYRLAGPTGLRSVQLAEGSLPPQLPLPDKPSIAVMPFANFSGDPDQEYFVDGMVEEISEGISFGRFRLDLGQRELLRDGQPVRMHRRALGILCAIAEAQGKIVSKDELMARLWPGRIVEEGNLHVHVSALRKALDEHGEGHSLIVTVPGRGYRLADQPGLRSAQVPVPPQLPLPDKPSIAVMPFQNSATIPIRNTSPTAWSRRSLPRFRASAGCS